MMIVAKKVVGLYSYLELKRFKEEEYKEAIKFAKERGILLEFTNEDNPGWMS